MEFLPSPTLFSPTTPCLHTSWPTQLYSRLNPFQGHKQYKHAAYDPVPIAEYESAAGIPPTSTHCRFCSTCRTRAIALILLLGALVLSSIPFIAKINRRCQESIAPASIVSPAVVTQQADGYAKNWAPRERAANQTLGFEKIYALTQGTPWRLDGLRAAAKHTGILIEEPRQAPISDLIVDAFSGFEIDERKLKPQPGAARSWLAHISLLQFVMQSNVGSALILEDDVDWDLRILEQMPAISDNIRTFSNSPEDDPDPYGPNWDVIWLGHCGEWTNERIPYLGWPDETVVPHHLYAGFARQYMDTLPEGVRTVSPTDYTVCSFGYAVSRQGVAKVLAAVNHGGDEAFDVALSASCRNDPDLRCYTVKPEIMHQYVPSPNDGFSSEVKAENGEAELAGTDVLAAHMGTTDNIMESVRCHVLWNSQCIGDSWTK